MGHEQIAVEREGPITRIRLNRPDRLNALTSTMSDELVDAFDGASSDTETRAVVLTGEGRGFCAGQDLTEFSSADDLDIKAHLERTYHRMIPRIVECTKPTIAAVNGVAAGAGVSLAAACDMRIAAASARFSQAFVKIGLVPDSGGTWLLPRILGPAKALELSLTGDMIDANEAERIGLVNRVVPDDALAKEASELAGRIAALAPLALSGAKELFRDSSRKSLEDALHAEADAQARLGKTEDFVEGVTAFVEKRNPKFRAR